ncbi:glycosyltransferase [Geobacillus stearothermophilus]|uniref:glycosyltransferase n=1 Tax=Geobacillus stearothermophilus TaxID=1422 RepID=UPI003D2382BE
MKILVIATQLPPYIGSGNIRALNYINYLSRLGHQIDVVGVQYPKDAVAYDQNLENAFDDDVNVYRINPGFLYRFFYRKKDDNLDNYNSNSASINSTIKGKISVFIKNTIVIPDAFMLWIYPAYKFAKKLMKNRDYDIIFSIHETPSSHLVAYLLKRKFNNIRWVGYWSDPWNGDSLRNNRTVLKKYIEEKIENKIVRKIDKLLFTTEKTKNLYINKYGLNESKASIVFRGYDKKIYIDSMRKSKESLEGLQKNKLNILHLGTIYHTLRDISPLCAALDLLKREDIKLYNLLNIIFIGQFDNYEDQRKLQKHSNVKVFPLVPYEQALQYTAKADVLLLYGNKKSTQVPGKVYEYLGSSAIILTLLGDPQDELKNIMENVEKGPVILNNEKEIYLELKKLSEAYLNNNLNKNWMKPVDKYEWENVVKDLEMKLIN